MHKDTVLCHIKVYAAEFVDVFLMNRLCIHVLEEIRMEPLCIVGETDHVSQSAGDITLHYVDAVVLHCWNLSNAR